MTAATEFFPAVERWQIPESVLVDSYAEMERDGRERDTEGIVLWAGRRLGEACAELSHVVLLRGPGISRHHDFIRIQSWLVNDVTDELSRIDAYLIGQIHSHAPAYGVGLSRTDRLYGIGVPYYLSVVAPDFATNPPAITTMGAHVFDPTTGWRRVETRVLEILASIRVPVLTVGGP